MDQMRDISHLTRWQRWRARMAQDTEREAKYLQRRAANRRRNYKSVGRTKVAQREYTRRYRKKLKLADAMALLQSYGFTIIAPPGKRIEDLIASRLPEAETQAIPPIRDEPVSSPVIETFGIPDVDPI